jgi:hypothetical protein
MVVESARTDYGSTDDGTLQLNGTSDIQLDKLGNSSGGGGFFDMVEKRSTLDSSNSDVGGNFFSSVEREIRAPVSPISPILKPSANRSPLTSLTDEYAISPSVKTSLSGSHSVVRFNGDASNNNSSSTSALMRAGHDLMMMNPESQQLPTTTTSTINVLNDQGDYIGRHEGFQKKTFGFVKPVTGKKKNIENAYGPKDRRIGGGRTGSGRKSAGKRGGKNSSTTSKTYNKSAAGGGHLSIDALKSLLGGSRSVSFSSRSGSSTNRSKGSRSNGVIMSIPGTPGVLARAVNSHEQRKELEETMLYDYRSGNVGGIGLSFNKKESFELEPS